jgi:N-acetylmuramoyl-L-alanine amidase
MAQRFLWLLDAGHAPATPGKRSPRFEDDSRLYEWEFARHVVDLVAGELEDRGIAHHVLTPRTDADMGPSQRAALANYIAGALGMTSRLLSIHANAHGDGHEFNDAHGLTVLYYPTSEKGKDMAQQLQARLVGATGLRDRGIKPRDDLSLLKRTHMPAVLSENGFYTNREECELLRSLDFRMKVAHAHAEFIASAEPVS